MDDSWRLFMLSVAMFLGSFLAGMVPLAMSLSEVCCELFIEIFNKIPLDCQFSDLISLL